MRAEVTPSGQVVTILADHPVEETYSQCKAGEELKPGKRLVQVQLEMGPPSGTRRLVYAERQHVLRASGVFDESDCAGDDRMVHFEDGGEIPLYRILYPEDHTVWWVQE